MCRKKLKIQALPQNKRWWKRFSTRFTIYLACLTFPKFMYHTKYLIPTLFVSTTFYDWNLILLVLWSETCSFQISGIIEHIHFAVVDCVLLAVGWNHSTDIPGRAIVRQICAIHNDPRYVQVSMNILKYLPYLA